MLEQGRASSRREQRTHGTDRPRWWAVLAVALALMALVASVTAANSARRGTGPWRNSIGRSSIGRTSIRRPAHAGAPDGRSDDTTTTVGQDGSTAGALGATGSGAVAAAADSASDPVVSTSSSSSGSAQPVPAPVGTTSRTSTAGSPSAEPASTTTTTTDAESGSAGPTTTTDPGFLAYPGNVSASYPVTAAGPVSASASWTGSSDLSLSVSCPGRQDQKTGPSGLSVAIGAAAATTGAADCTVVIAEPVGTEATVSYSLTIDSTAT